jgi:SAM-dependent methyltransferase
MKRIPGSSSSDWDKEYSEFQTIPSSTRKSPSKALLLFAELLALRNPGSALDAGCGNGRNSIYLANQGWTVEALDYSQRALDYLAASIRGSELTNRIHRHHLHLNPPLPFPDASFDLVLDSFVSCHFTDSSFQEAYWAELLRLTKPTGHVFTSLFSVDDEYYKRVGSMLDREQQIVIDPNNGIIKRLYTESQIKLFFQRRCSIKYYANFEFVDSVLLRPYRRSILTLVLEPTV